jgi:Holliday junction resolvase RusA-like endonuclease
MEQASSADLFSVTFFVRGHPKGEPRKRFDSRRPGAPAHPPQKDPSVKWRADLVRQAALHRPACPLEGTVRVDWLALLPRPQRLCRRKDPPGLIWAPTTPDRDNLDKAILDALAADGWFHNDKQVATGTIGKAYHSKGGVPGAWIRIRELAGTEFPDWVDVPGLVSDLQADESLSWDG